MVVLTARRLDDAQLAGTVQTVDQLRGERDYLRNLLAEVVRRCAHGGDDDPYVLAVLSNETFEAIQRALLRGGSG